MMIKRIIIAGCRDYTDYDEAKAYIEMCIKKIKERYTLIFLSGGCKGADMLGERYADENGFYIERYPADWKKYGKRAGSKRPPLPAPAQSCTGAKICSCYFKTACYNTGKPAKRGRRKGRGVYDRRSAKGLGGRHAPVLR